MTTTRVERAKAAAERHAARGDWAKAAAAYERAAYGCQGSLFGAAKFMRLSREAAARALGGGR